MFKPETPAQTLLLAGRAPILNLLARTILQPMSRSLHLDDRHLHALWIGKYWQGG
jgi:hypothetical protein